MGLTAGKAADQILYLLENPSKVLPKAVEWDRERIIPGAGSKNHGTLKFTHDLLISDRTNDNAALNEAWIALDGYLNVAKDKCHFHGEEYSTIYWRWIILPIWISGRVARKRGRADLADRIDKWVQDFVVINALSALNSLHYIGSEYGGADGKVFKGMPCSSILMARSWVCNDGPSGYRTIEAGLTWGDAPNHAPWLAWVLGRWGSNQVVGWVGGVVRATEKLYGKRDVLSASVRAALNATVNDGVYPEALVEALEHGPWKPMVVCRTASGTWCVGERSFTSGSTSFMHCKVLPSSTLSYEMFGIATPLKRTNNDPGKAVLAEDMRSCTLIADDGTVWDWNQEKERPGTLLVPLLDGEILWAVRLQAGKKPVRLDAQGGQEPPQNGDDGWCGWFTRLFG
jgi:hypothetical protein